MNNHSETESSGHNSVHCDADNIPGWNEDLELAFLPTKALTLPEK